MVVAILLQLSVLLLLLSVLFYHHYLILVSGEVLYESVNADTGRHVLPLPEIGGHGSMFPYMYIRILTAANVLRALRASRERSACSQQTSEKLSSNWKHALETHG